MNKKWSDLEANRLYVVKPSIVLSDDTRSHYRELLISANVDYIPVNLSIYTPLKELIKGVYNLMRVQRVQKKALAAVKEAEENNINVLTHVVEFERKPEDTTIVMSLGGSLRRFEKGPRINEGVGSHCIEGDMHIGVDPNDKVLLARYLWEAMVFDTEWTNQIERYVLALKPYYTLEEINVALKTIKEDSIEREKPETFKLIKRREAPIYIPRNVYTDPC